MPSLKLYDDGGSSMEFSPEETRLHQIFWSNLKYKTADGIMFAVQNITLLEMHKHFRFEKPTKQ